MFISAFIRRAPQNLQLNQKIILLIVRCLKMINCTLHAINKWCYIRAELHI